MVDAKVGQALLHDLDKNMCIQCDKDTPFYKNWVSTGSTFEKLAFNDPKYVDGNVTIRFDKVQGISGRTCPIGWARDARGGRKKSVNVLVVGYVLNLVQMDVFPSEASSPSSSQGNSTKYWRSSPPISPYFVV